jgi:hypothetical protein
MSAAGSQAAGNDDVVAEIYANASAFLRRRVFER